MSKHRGYVIAAGAGAKRFYYTGSGYSLAIHRAKIAWSDSSRRAMMEYASVNYRRPRMRVIEVEAVIREVPA